MLLQHCCPTPPPIVAESPLTLFFQPPPIVEAFPVMLFSAPPAIVPRKSPSCAVLVATPDCGEYA